MEKKLPVYGNKLNTSKRKRVPNSAGRLFWDLYALVYDLVMLRSMPYRQLIQDVCTSIGLPYGGRLLDAGCGTGNFLEPVVRQPGARAIGLDSSAAMLRRARKKLEGCSNASLQEGDLNQPLPFAEGFFDGVICVNVLYSTADPFFTLAQLKQALKDGGRLVLVTPPVKPKMFPLFAEQLRAFRKRYPLGWPFYYGLDLLCLMPYMPLFLGINFFIKGNRKFHFFSREELSVLVQSAGFQVKTLKKTYAGQGWFLVGEAAGCSGEDSHTEKVSCLKK